MKICTKCGLKKPLAAFSKKTAMKDGLQPYCKECDAKANRAWREANPGENRARSARWREANPERQHANHACWQRANPEQNRASTACWQRANPEKRRTSNRRRRARTRGVSEHFTAEMARFVRAFWNHQCAFCSATTRLELDHWHPLFRGHALTMSNAVLLCKSCNDSKGRKLLKDLDNQKLVAAVEQRLVEQAERWEVFEQFAFDSAG